MPEQATEASPLQDFKWNIRLLRMFFKLIFQDIFDRNYRYGFGFAVMVLAWLSIVANYVYTMAVYESSGSLILLEFAYMCGTFQVSRPLNGNNHPETDQNLNMDNLYFSCKTLIKYALMRYMQPLLDILEYAERIYGKYDTGEERALCERFARLTQILLKSWIAAYVCMIGIGTSPLIIEYFSTGRLTPCMHAYFVGVRQYSNELFFILNCYNCAMMVLLVLTLVPIDGLIYVTFANVPLVSLVIRLFWHAYGSELEQNPQEAYKVKQRLVIAITMIKDYLM